MLAFLLYLVRSLQYNPKVMNPIWKKRLFWFLLLIPLMGAGPCQGVMLGGSEGLGTGSSAGGDADDDDDSGSSSSSPGEDTTKFRPASLPPAVDEPSYAITASLSVSGSTATVSGTVTNASSGAVAASVNVTVTLFTLSTASAELSDFPSLVTGSRDKLEVSGTEKDTKCVSTSSTGAFQAAFGSGTYNASTDKIDVTVGCGSDAAGGSKDVRLGDLHVINIYNAATGLAVAGTTVTNLALDVKFDGTIDLSSASPTSITITCDGSLLTGLLFSETSPPTDNIALNEVHVEGTLSNTTDVSCDATVNVGLKNISGGALTAAFTSSFTKQGSGTSGGSGGTGGSAGTGGTGGSTSTSLSVSSITTTATSGTSLSGASITSMNGVTVTFNQAPTTAPSTSNTTVVCTTAGSLPLTIATTSSTVYAISSTIKLNSDSCTLTIGTGTGLASASTTVFTFAFHVFDTTPNATLTGQQSGSLFGTSIVLGDVDNNSIADIIVGAPGYDDGANSNMGRVTYYAGASGLLPSPSVTPNDPPVVTITGSNPANPLLGTSVCYRSGATPVIVAGSPLYFVSGTARGAIETYNTTSGVLIDTITAPAAGTRFGESCAVGNFDGDSTRDILVGAKESTSVGGAYVYEGTKLLQNFSGAGSSNTDFGQTVANLGDVNGDNIDDFAIAATSQSVASNSTGKVFFHLGNSSGLQGTASQTFTSSASTGLYGRAIAGGDVNGDGRSDMFVGAPGSGLILGYHGSSSGLASSATTQIGSFGTGTTSGDEGLGGALATVDVDKDSFADLVALKIPLGGSGAISGTIKLFIYRGSSSGLITTPFATIDLGTSVANGSSNGSIAVGDYNGDGNVDIAVGVAETTTSSAGEVFLFTNEF